MEIFSMNMPDILVNSLLMLGAFGLALIAVIVLITLSDLRDK